MTKVAKTSITEASDLEAAFLAGLEEAQGAYERIVATQAWTALGFGSFAAWWDERVAPTMRALSMKPTREIAAAVIEQVRQEEAALPPTQRRTQQELADMVGVSQQAISARSLPHKKLSGDDLEDAASQIPALIPDAGKQAPAELPGQQDLADAFLSVVDDLASAPAPRKIEQPDEPAVTDMDRALAARAAVDAVTDRLLPPDLEAPHRMWRINFLSAIQPALRLMAGFTVDAVAEHADDECLDELRRLAQEVGTYYEQVRVARPVPDNVRHLRAV